MLLTSTLVRPNPFIFSSFAFKIDTGCDVTTLSLNDASRIDLSRLGCLTFLGIEELFQRTPLITVLCLLILAIA